MSIEPTILLQLAPFLTKISHTSGRLRLRVSPKIKSFIENENINLDQVLNGTRNFNGIKEVKFNRLIGSLTIFYDESVIEYAIWENLLSQQNLDEVAQKLNDILKEA